MKNSGMEISVLIPCYEMHGTLFSLLESLQQGFAPEIQEILVCCDGCKTECRFPTGGEIPVRHLKREENRGLSYTRNELLSHCQTEGFWFLDADTMPDSSCREILQKFSGETLTAGQEATAPILTDWDFYRFHFFRQTFGEKALEEVPFCMGLCFLGTKSLLGEKRFSLELVSHGEDLDLSYRLRKQGVGICYEPDLRVCHQRKDSFRSFCRMVFLHGYWQARMMKRHKEKTWPLFSAQFRWFGISFASLIFRHKKTGLALLSPVLNGLSLGAKVWGWFRE